LPRIYVPETQALNRQVRRIASGGPKLEAIYCLKRDNSHPEMDIGHVLFDSARAVTVGGAGAPQTKLSECFPRQSDLARRVAES